MIPGNPNWNLRVAALATQSRPLYTFEIPDEGLIITSFYPDEAGVVVDTANLLTQPLWAQASSTAAALKAVSLPPTMGYLLPGDDGGATSLPPTASVIRYNYGAGITGYTSYLSWRGVGFPVGMPSPTRAISIDLVLLSSLVLTPTYTPYGDINYSTISSPAALSTWYSAVHSNPIGGWVASTTTVRLWPGNPNVGPVQPKLDNIQIQITQTGTTTGSSPGGNVLTVTPSLLLSFL